MSILETAPLLTKVFNVSGETVHIEDIEDKSFDIDDGESQLIDCFLPNDNYMKIYIGREKDQEYLLKYVHPNIKINDSLGKHNGVSDSSIRVDYPYKEIRIAVMKGELHISCHGKYLGIYQPDEYPIFYATVAARHIIPQGGITLFGGLGVDGDGDVKGEEDEESTKVSDA